MRPGQYERLGLLLAEMEAEVGPIPPELLEEARQLWRPKERDGDPSLADVDG